MPKIDCHECYGPLRITGGGGCFGVKGGGQGVVNVIGPYVSPPLNPGSALGYFCTDHRKIQFNRVFIFFRNFYQF